MRKMNKRSQGHVEMILSFILFIGAILFIFFYINPFTKTTDNSDEINQIQNIIIRNITATVGRLSVLGNSAGCYNFIDGDYPSTNYVEVKGNTPNLYTIYFGDADVFPDIIKPNKGSCSDYSLGIFSNETIISYRKLKQLAYDGKDNIGAASRYQDLKKNLGINMDFVISVTDLDRNPIPELSFSKNIPRTVEVESREFPMVAVNESGNDNQIIFNLRVW